MAGLSRLTTIMHQTFDKKVPRYIQLPRVAGMKQKGWKHKSKRRSWKVKEKAKRVAAHKKIQRDRFKAKVRAFWAAKTDE